MAIEITYDTHRGTLIKSPILGLGLVVSYPDKKLIIYNLSTKGYDKISFTTQKDALNFVQSMAIVPGKKSE
jgi:hypothetical protein